MIPLRDNVPTQRFPTVCVLLIALNVLIFLADRAQRVVVILPTSTGYAIRDVVGSLSARYAMIPAAVTGHVPPGTPGAVQPIWLTIFTSMFLHANWLHVGGNMLYLWVFGKGIEDALGHIRFVFFYLLCGLAAAMLQISTAPASTVPMIGASGAVAGLMGAYLLLYTGARVLSIVPIFGIVSTFLEIPALIVIGFWFVLQVLNARWLGSSGMLTRGGGVAYVAHIGGFVAGMVLILLCGGRNLLRTGRRYR